MVHRYFSTLTLWLTTFLFNDLQLKKIADFRKDNEKIVKNLNPSEHKKAFTETDVLNVLIDKDHLGRRMIVLKQGANWNPDQISVDEIFQLLYYS